MKIKEIILFAINNLKARKLRSWLTIIGITIGIALIVTLLSLGQGLRAGVSQQLSAFGSDLIYVLPGEEGMPFIFWINPGTWFTDKDVKTIEEIAGVKEAVGMSFTTFSMTYKGETKQVLMHGLPEKAEEIFKKSEGWDFAEGRWPKDNEYAIAIGYWLAKEGFNKEIKLNKEVEIKGIKFKVVGIFAEIGERNHDYHAIYMPLNVYREVMDTKNIDTIVVQASSGIDIDALGERIKKTLKRERDAEDFAVITPKKSEKIVSNIIMIIEVVLIAIASIALIVGGVGIMNTMYTSVLERTRQIGVMKAIGARDKHILSIFILEAGIIGLIGGILGIAFGILISKGIEVIAIASGFKLLKIIIKPGIVIFALAFAFLIGVISGFMPAKQASKLNPVEALRYE